MLYKCNGYHFRYENGIQKMYKPGDLIEPNKFELESFSKRFDLVNPDVIEKEPEPEEGTLENPIDIDDELVKAKQSLRDIIDNSEEWEPSVITDANKLYAKNPQRTDKKVELVKLITNFISELE